MGLSKTLSWTAVMRTPKNSSSVPEPARQRREAVGQRQHQFLALVQVVGDDDALGVVRRRLEMAQEAGQDAGDVGAAGPRRVRDLAHQPDIAAAEEQIEALLGKPRAEPRRVARIGGIDAGRGAAEDADDGLLIHGGGGVAVPSPSS